MITTYTRQSRLAQIKSKPGFKEFCTKLQYTRSNQLPSLLEIEHSALLWRMQVLMQMCLKSIPSMLQT